MKQLKDMQGMNEKIIALGRFISKSAKKAMPLFHTSKGFVNKNNFRWAKESAQVLE